MMRSETELKLEALEKELLSLTNFSHDNQYVGILIADRITLLANEINFYKMSLSQRKSQANHSSVETTRLSEENKPQLFFTPEEFDKYQEVNREKFKKMIEDEFNKFVSIDEVLGKDD